MPMLFKTSNVFCFTSLTSAKRFPFIWPTLESYLKLRATLKQFQQPNTLTENKTSRTLFVLYYQPSQKSLNFLADTKEKSHNNNGRPRLTPCGRLLEYCVDLRHLVGHRATTSSLCTTFKFWLFWGPPSYLCFAKVFDFY